MAYEVPGRLGRRTLTPLLSPQSPPAVLEDADVPVSSYHFLIGPLIAVAALGVLVLLCCWVFSTTHRDDRNARRLAALASRGDYGLLVPVATTRTVDDAEMLRGVLQQAGIRCTTGGSQDGSGTEVLVFRADALRARDLVRS